MVAAKKQPDLNADELYVGQLLRERRLAMKMSQSDLGAVAGISFQQIQKYERGINRISFSTLQKFADALKTPIQHFLRDSGAASAVASGQKQAPFTIPTRDTQELIRLFGEIDDPAVRKQVLQLAKALVESQTKSVKKKTK